MSDWEKGVLRVHESAVLGNPLLEIPEPRLRETGILTVEQLRAFELRLHKYIGVQIAESTKHLTERSQERFQMAEEQAERRARGLQGQVELVARDAAERGLDYAVRLHAVDQRAQERSLELTRTLTVMFTSIQTHATTMETVNQEQYVALTKQMEQFRQDVENRTTLGRLRRLWAWTVQQVRRVRYGR